MFELKSSFHKNTDWLRLAGTSGVRLTSVQSDFTKTVLNTCESKVMHVGLNQRLPCSSCNSLKNKKDHSNLVPVLAPGRYQTSDSYTQCSSIGGLIWGASAEGVRAAGWLHSVLPLNERWLEMRWWSSWGPPSPCGSSSQCHAALRKLPQSKSGFDLRAPALRLQMSPSASSHSHAATLAHGSWF